MKINPQCNRQGLGKFAKKILNFYKINLPFLELCFIFNLFFKFYFKNNPSRQIFAYLTFFGVKNTLSHHMHWRDKMYYVGTIRSAQKASVSE